VRLLRFARRLLVLDGRRDGRLFVAAALACYFGTILTVSLATDAFDLWRYLGVLHIKGPFEDMRVITSGWECTRRGIDVLAENPCDPFHREMNYPRIWTELAPLGLGQGSTVALSLAAWVAFYLAVFLSVGRLTLGEGIVYSAVLLSPSVMLGVASANNDLLIFALVAAAVSALHARRSVVRAASYGLFLLAALLKLYPVFAFTVLLRQAPRRAALALAFSLIVFALYVAATLDDLRLIDRGTPRPTRIAYGASVLAKGVENRFAHLPGSGVLAESPTRALLYAGSLLLASGLAVWLAGRLRPMPEAARTDRTFDAFLAGASIYVGTFFVPGTNWDYRLVFLLLTIPQLLRWIEGVGPLATASAYGLAGVVGTLWLSRLPWILPLDEVLNLALVVFFAAVLLQAAPSWLRRSLRPSSAVGPGPRVPAEAAEPASTGCLRRRR
jgi:Glycosyltransferase family 87